jgi:hypothetical protein
MRGEFTCRASFAARMVTASALCAAAIVTTRWATIRPPGHRGASLAARTGFDALAGVSVGDLCRMLKNPKLNGNRTLQALVEHMESEPLVLWGWNPGRGREAVPIPHGEFVNLMKVWMAGGTVCPE